jgi:hypothetical protein
MAFNEKGVKTLVTAVVKQALKDYRMASEALERNPNDLKADEVKFDIELFSHSQWFDFLCQINPDISDAFRKEDIA